MNEVDFEAEERKFAPLVGRAILDFGRIEFCSLQAAEILPHETILKTAANLPLTARLDLLIEIFQGRRKKGEAVNRFIALLQICKKLTKTRNIIAHNPLLVEMSFPKGGCHQIPKICKYLDREKKVTQEQLIKFCEDTASLADELEDSIHSVLIETFEKR